MTLVLTMSSAMVVTVLLMLSHGFDASQASLASIDPRSRCHGICWKATSSGDDAKNCLGACIRFISDVLELRSGGIDAFSASSATDGTDSPSRKPQRLSNRPDASSILDQLMKRGQFVRIGKPGEFNQGRHRRTLSIPGAPFFGQGLQRGARLNADDSFEQRKFSHFVRIGRGKGAFVRIGKGKINGALTAGDAKSLRLACEGWQDAGEDRSSGSSSCRSNN